jgi:hypothetical protein
MSHNSFYIVAVTGNDLVAKGIQKFSGGPYVHVGISLDNSFTNITAFNFDVKTEKLKIEFTDGLFKEGFSDYDPEGRYSIYEVKVTQNIFYRIERLIEDIELNIEEFGYNFIGIMGFLYKKFWGVKENLKETSFFCSQFVAYILEEAGVHKFKKPVYQVTPTDITKVGALKLRKRGKVKNFSPDMVLKESYEFLLPN